MSLKKERFLKLKVLIVCSGPLGMRRQLEAVAMALQKSYGWEYDEWVSELRWPWMWFVFALPKFPASWLWKKKPPHDMSYDVVITCGRRGALSMRAVRDRSATGQSILVSIDDPRHGHKDFDLLLIPDHDRVGGNLARNAKDKIFRFPGALSPFNNDKSSNHTVVDRTPAPQVGLLLGGSGKGLGMTKDWVDQLVEAIRVSKSRSSVSWLVTFSRRTPQHIRQRLTERLTSLAWIWDGRGDNPLPAMIRRSDHLVVSIDSTSMLLQAAASPARLHLLKLPGHRQKIDRLTAALVSKGRARWFDYDSFDDDNNPSRPSQDAQRYWNSVPAVCEAIVRMAEKRQIAEKKLINI